MMFHYESPTLLSLFTLFGCELGMLIMTGCRYFSPPLHWVTDKTAVCFIRDFFTKSSLIPQRGKR